MFPIRCNYLGFSVMPGKAVPVRTRKFANLSALRISSINEPGFDWRPLFGMGKVAP